MISLPKGPSTPFPKLIRPNTYNIEFSHKKNFFEKLGSLKKTLSIWSRRDLSIYGRINIVKTLTLSKLVFISSVMETPKKFATEVNKIVFDFI